MRALGIHLSYWQTAWDDELTPLLKRAAAAGYDGAELPLLRPEALDFTALKATLDAQGLRATCGTGLGPQTDITHPDPTVRAAGVAHLRACLEGAATLGSPVLGGVTYAPWGAFPEDDHTARRHRCVTALRDVARIAEDVGVTLCLEILNRFEGYLLNTVTQGLQMLAEIDSPAVKLHLDTFHLNIEEPDIGAAIAAAGPRLGHLHCSANHRGCPGRGHIPWDEVRRALDAIDYEGWLVVEAYVRPEGQVGRDVFVWRPLSDTLDADARAAAAFLRREVADA
ncbi:MAG: sugar phosphate isomerase/epimerase family protein [Anaerolineae bacterium]